MHPLIYHDGQLTVQTEANTRHVADKLAAWVGPAGEYAAEADMLLLAYRDTSAGADALAFAAISGAPPIARAVGPGALALAAAADHVLPGGLNEPIRVGGLVLALARAERARINGTLRRRGAGIELAAEEAFTLCRKYMAPSVAASPDVVAGPAAREPIALDDPWVGAVVAAADTTFLASVAPDGMPDVAHRGGPAGFIALDAVRASASWTEFVGDGVFKSAGNVRATGTASLLLLDLRSGDALELIGSAAYENTLTRFRPREEPLVRMRDDFPEQGRMVLAIDRAVRLRRLTHPRQRVAAVRVTSRDATDEQAPR
jgi:hypothetical protein